MGGGHHTTDANRVLCAVCAERVGVYEPAVFVVGSVVNRSSRAAAPELEEIAGHTAFHAACYDCRFPAV
jgi:hypothetical protein